MSVMNFFSPQTVLNWFFDGKDYAVIVELFSSFSKLTSMLPRPPEFYYSDVSDILNLSVGKKADFVRVKQEP